MKLELYELVDRLNSTMLRQLADERLLRTQLRAMDDNERSEFCYYLLDTLARDLPAGSITTLQRVERYVGHQIGIANWEVKRGELCDELIELNDYCDDLIEDDWLESGDPHD